jgi:hypothetical protein
MSQKKLNPNLEVGHGAKKAMKKSRFLLNLRVFLVRN